MLPTNILEKKNFSDIPKDLYVDIFLFVEKNTIVNFNHNIFKSLKMTKINDETIQQEFIDREVFIEFDNLKINPNYIFEKFMNSNSFNDDNVSYLIYLKNKIFENNEIDFSIDNNYAIMWASSNGYIKLVELLLKDRRVDPSAWNNHAINQASENGHDKVVELLLNDKRVDPSAKDNHAIRQASENGHDKVVELLLKDKRVDPSDVNNWSIIRASKNGHDKVVELLMKDKRVNLSDDNNYAISFASGWGSL